MYMIPSQIISAITFPGVVIHELAHQLCCRIMRIPVYEVKYFQSSNPCGYVIHEKTEKPFANFLIAMGPFFINTILGALIVLPASVEVIKFKHYHNPISLILAWLGISILMHSFPSTGDAQTLIDEIMKNKKVNLFIKILIAPFIGLIYIGTYGSVVWLDLGYALLLGMMIPNIIMIFI